MKLKLKNIIIESCVFAYIVLFAYAAFSKLAAYETFTIQLGQSPLLSSFAGWVAWLIPGIEILIAVLLIFIRTRFVALVSAFGLMTMFSVYIYIILNYSEFIPCSCGGILEKMNWNQHLIFNVLFCVLAAIAITLEFHQLNNSNIFHKNRYLAKVLSATAFLS